MMDQSLPSDEDDFLTMAVETSGTFEEPITIKRWASQSTTPNPFGSAPEGVFATFPATAVIVEMNVAAKMFAAGVLSAGDLVIQIRDRLNEGSMNIGGAQAADRIIYRGMEYRMVQRPIPQSFGAVLGPDVPFFIVHLRRTNSTSDSVGL